MKHDSFSMNSFASFLRASELRGKNININAMWKPISQPKRRTEYVSSGNLFIRENYSHSKKRFMYHLSNENPRLSSVRIHMAIPSDIAIYQAGMSSIMNAKSWIFFLFVFSIITMLSKLSKKASGRLSIGSTYITPAHLFLASSRYLSSALLQKSIASFSDLL